MPKKNEMSGIMCILFVIVVVAIYLITMYWYIVIAVIGAIGIGVFIYKKQQQKKLILSWQNLLHTYREIHADKIRNGEIKSEDIKVSYDEIKRSCPYCNEKLKFPFMECQFCGWATHWLDEIRGTDRDRSRLIPEYVRHEVWRRDQGRCVQCKSQERLEFDHIIPFSKGGSNTTRNIQLLCEECNRKKYNHI